MIRAVRPIRVKALAFSMGLACLVALASLSALATGLLFGCSDDENGGAADDRLATFRFSLRVDPAGAEDFIAQTRDPFVIDSCRAELSRPKENRLTHIHGVIARTNGGKNLAWSWRFVPGEWRLVDFSMELCDGLPSQVEARTGYWIDTLQVFCPWNSYVAEELP